MDKSLLDIYNLGNFTKFAVKRFEENIVNQRNFLENINTSKLGEEYKFKEE